MANRSHQSGGPGDSRLFWVSGAWSIDQAYRVEGRDWWRDEELTAKQSQDAFDDYVVAKPRVMISHDGPRSLFLPGAPMALPYFVPASTANLLQAMLEAHEPEVWLFGHHHVSQDFTLGRTRFRCLAELEIETLLLG